MFIDVPNDVDRPHLKRQDRFRTPQRRRDGGLFIEDARYREFRETFPRFAGQYDAAVGEEVGFSFA